MGLLASGRMVLSPSVSAAVVVVMLSRAIWCSTRGDDPMVMGGDEVRRLDGEACRVSVKFVSSVFQQFEAKFLNSKSEN